MSDATPGTVARDRRTLRRWFAVCVVILVLWAVWLILKPLITPIVWAAVLGFLLYPSQQHLTRVLGNRPSAAAGILTGLTPVAIVVPLALIGLAFVQQISSLATTLQENRDVFALSRWLDPAQHPRIAGMAEPR